jgi:hypothetical protein
MSTLIAILALAAILFVMLTISTLVDFADRIRDLEDEVEKLKEGK